MIKRNDGSPAKLHQVRDRHGGGSEQNLDRDRNAQDRLEIGEPAGFLGGARREIRQFPERGAPALERLRRILRR
jgi:hypothetical protein